MLANRGWVLIGLVMMTPATGCTVSPSVAHSGGSQVGSGRTWVFMCPDESSYVVRSTESDAWVFRDGSSVRLHAVPSATPLRYAQDNVQLVIEGDQGRLFEPGKGTVACRNDPQRAVWEHAKLDGVDFRGIGNEPPWVLEIREQSRMVLITEYGANRIERLLPQPSNDTIRETTRWDTGDLQVEITADICPDTMSGEIFSSRVVVSWQGRVLRGCGRPLH